MDKARSTVSKAARKLVVPSTRKQDSVHLRRTHVPSPVARRDSPSSQQSLEPRSRSHSRSQPHGEAVQSRLWKRRASTFSSEKSSQRSQKVVYENTFKCEPDTKFSETRLRIAVEEVMKEYLAHVEYDKDTIGEKTCELTEKIKAKVKTAGMTRHKLIVTVFTSQISEGSLQVTSRCMWEPRYDNFVTVNFKTPQLQATAVVYAVYYD